MATPTSDRMPRLTSEKVLKGLESEGINNLQDLAARVAEESQRSDGDGNPIVSVAVVIPEMIFVSQ